MRYRGVFVYFSQHVCIQHVHTWQAFVLLDVNAGGSVSRNEMSRGFKVGLSCYPSVCLGCALHVWWSTAVRTRLDKFVSYVHVYVTQRLRMEGVDVDQLFKELGLLDDAEIDAVSFFAT